MRGRQKEDTKKKKKEKKKEKERIYCHLIVCIEEQR